jgi:hypothetical protein
LPILRRGELSGASRLALLTLGAADSGKVTRRGLRADALRSMLIVDKIDTLLAISRSLEATTEEDGMLQPHDFRDEPLRPPIPGTDLRAGLVVGRLRSSW